MANSGGCLCSEVRFSASAAPLAARVCWCRLCQYLGGGGGMVSVCFRTDSVSVQGNVSWYESIADSGNRMQRGFCPKCGTPLFSKAESRPHLIFIRAGALDDPNLMAPQMTIWTNAAPDWACFDPALPKIAGQPPPVA
ncbi:MAG TPA: GFA family protein [Aestuariivirga sp.]|nr:GFA family protein [Aestuariivirga sp.]